MEKQVKADIKKQTKKSHAAAQRRKMASRMLLLQTNIRPEAKIASEYKGVHDARRLPTAQRTAERGERASVSL